MPIHPTVDEALDRFFPSRTIPMHCRHCNAPLPDDCPPVVTSCRSYADWRARQAGDMLTEDESLDCVNLHTTLLTYGNIAYNIVNLWKHRAAGRSPCRTQGERIKIHKSLLCNN